MISHITKHPLIYIFAVALILRLAFSFYFQQFYFGEFVFKYRDTASYLDPILNLINHGSYMGDFYLEDSKYFRVPVYPTFLGFVHLVFGVEHFDYAVAIIQSLLDSFSALLVYLIIRKITNSHSMALLSGLIYATYPFVILWSPISYTEVLQAFFIFLLLYVVLVKQHDMKYAFLQGVLVGILILTKQYLGLFIFVPVLTLLFSTSLQKTVREKVILIAMVLIGMGAILSPWVVRNYIHSGKIIVMKAESTGLRARGLDFEAFERFANLFNENITPMMNAIAYESAVTFDKHTEFVAKHKEQIDSVVKQAHECGTSFMEIRNSTGYNAPHKGCDDEVIKGFDTLTALFWDEIPLSEAIETRLDAVKKILMKTDILYTKIAFSKTELIKTALFRYRVVLILLGMLGIVLIVINVVSTASKAFVVGVALTVICFYAYFTLVIVHVEMRYILVPDVLMSVFASVSIIALMDKIKDRLIRHA
jgi:4-amino-4-deoxy-L-arabinose transferase-like glycosyltransferase